MLKGAMRSIAFYQAVESLHRLALPLDDIILRPPAGGCKCRKAGGDARARSGST
jgi:hypothetical protein